MRIVSLIASATEIVHSLGLTPWQVGRSHECDYPPEICGLPVCTTPDFPTRGSSAEIDRLVKEKLRSALSIYSVFTGVLKDLQPTHILTQTQCKVCAVSLEDVERALGNGILSQPRVVPLEPNSLAGIWTDVQRVAAACGVPERGQAVIRTLQDGLSDLSARTRQSAFRPRVACIEWHQPLMAAGNWVPELIELANAGNLFGEAGRHSPWMTWPELESADPDVIVTMPCGFDLPRIRQEMYWLADRPEWPRLRAAKHGRIYLADGNRYMNRPGPTVVDSLRILAEILHPDVFPPTLEGIAWQRWHV